RRHARPVPGRTGAHAVGGTPSGGRTRHASPPPALTTAHSPATPHSLLTAPPGVWNSASVRCVGLVERTFEEQYRAQCHHHRVWTGRVYRRHLSGSSQPEPAASRVER